MYGELTIALIFVSATAGTFALLRAFFGPERRMASRLRGVSDYVSPEATHPGATGPTAGRSVLRKPVDASSWLSRTSRNLWPVEYREKSRRLLSSAGRVTTKDVDAFLNSKIIYGAVGAVLMAVLGLAFGWGIGFLAILALGAGAGGFLLPDSRVKDAIKDRRYQIVRELPDVLDMLTISVTAGLGFEAAIAKLVKNSRGMVVSEFERMLKEVNAGSSRKQAMRAMAERIDAPEMTAFVSAITQAESFGTPIASVLRVQSGELRLKRRQRAEEEAAKAPVKMTIPLMLIILPATILLLLGPAMVSLATAFG